MSDNMIFFYAGIILILIIIPCAIADNNEFTIKTGETISISFEGNDLEIKLEYISPVSGSYIISVNEREFEKQRLSAELLIDDYISLKGASYSSESLTFNLLESDMILEDEPSGVNIKRVWIEKDNLNEGDYSIYIEINRDDGSPAKQSDGVMVTINLKYPSGMEREYNLGHLSQNPDYLMNHYWGFGTDICGTYDYEITAESENDKDIKAGEFSIPCAQESDKEITAYTYKPVETTFNGKKLIFALISVNENTGSYKVHVNGNDFESYRLVNEIVVDDYVSIKGKGYSAKSVTFELMETNQKLPCIDSDDGKDYYTQGAVTFDGNRHVDYCVPRQEALLVEAFCEDDFQKLETIECAYKCRDGKCLAPPGNSEIIAYTYKPVETTFNGKKLSMALRKVNADTGGYDIVVNAKEFSGMRLTTELQVEDNVAIKGKSYSAKSVTFELLATEKVIESNDNNGRDSMLESDDELNAHVSESVIRNFNGRKLEIMLKNVDINTGAYRISVNGRDFETGRFSDEMLVEDYVSIKGISYSSDNIKFRLIASGQALGSADIAEENKFCTDSDGGINYDVRGKVISDEGEFDDICENAYTVTENYCAENIRKTDSYRCDNGCVDGKCKTESNEVSYCDGCNDEGRCIPYGTRTGQRYCDLSKELLIQKGESESCSNNYECKTNLCVDSRCLQAGIIEQIMLFFQRLFGL